MSETDSTTTPEQAAEDTGDAPEPTTPAEPSAEPQEPSSPTPEATEPQVDSEGMPVMQASHLNLGPVSPFSTRAVKTFKVDKPVTMLLLGDELAKVTKRDDLEIAGWQGDLEADLSPENPMTLFITPADIDTSVVRRAISKHVPDPTYGMSVTDKAKSDLLARLEAKEALSQDDLQEALRLVLGGQATT